VPFKNFSRIRPKHMIHDKEELYDQALSMKKYVNFVREENVKLKTKLQTIQVNHLEIQ